MIKTTKKIVQFFANILGYKITKLSSPDPIIDSEFGEIYNKCRPYTMTTKERMYALYKAVQYIITTNIPGDFVECGVWKGGSTMVIAYTLLEMGDVNRKIYLYDTFEGMPKPTEHDYAITDKNFRAISIWRKHQRDRHNQWCYASLSEVKKNMFATGYPEDKIIFVKGEVQDTIPNEMPLKIALLRIDTDFYESTKHELIHLFPVIVHHGVLLIDDYGTWAGSKKAVDEYFSQKNILLNRVDHDGRIGIKIE